MLLEGKKVLVTGGAQGIGKEIIMKCLAEGASIHYCDFNEGPHKAEMDAAAKNGATVTFHSANITDEDQVKALIKDITSDGKLDVLVNNAVKDFLPKDIESNKNIIESSNVVLSPLEIPDYAFWVAGDTHQDRQCQALPNLLPATHWLARYRQIAPVCLLLKLQLRC